jgi:hypothetical protein
MFLAKFWVDFDAKKITIEEALSDPWKYANYFKGGLTNFNPQYTGKISGAGQQFDKDGVTITDTDNYKIVFQWDTTGKLHMLTGFPVP